MKKPNRTLVVLAAGMGSRYGGLKQIDPLGPSGESLLEFSVHDAVCCGFDRIVFVIRESFAEAFSEKVACRFYKKAALEIAFQRMDDLPVKGVNWKLREKPWGTGHALWATRDHFDETDRFAVINADDFYGRGAYKLAAEFFDNPEKDFRGRYLLVAYRLGQTLSDHGSVSRGVLSTDNTGRLKTIVEHTRIESSPVGPVSIGLDDEITLLSPDTLVSMNFFGLRGDIFKHLPALFEAFLLKTEKNPGSEFYLPAVLSHLMEKGSAVMDVIPTDDRWMGITHPSDRNSVGIELSRLIKSGCYPSRH